MKNKFGMYDGIRALHKSMRRFKHMHYLAR